MRHRFALCGELVVWFSLIKTIIQSRELFARVFLSRRALRAQRFFRPPTTKFEGRQDNRIDGFFWTQISLILGLVINILAAKFAIR